jgi:hypothetical protein
VQVKFRLTKQLTEELSSLVPAEMTPEKLTQFQTKVKVISIMDTIISTLWSNGHRDLCYSAKIEGKITFLMQMLVRKQDIWIQQTSDFSALLKDLLLTVSQEVKALETNQSSLSKVFKKMLNPFKSPASKQIDVIDHRVCVGYHLLKDAWYKCINCKHLNFRSLGSAEACMSCGKSLLISKPEF